MKMTPEEAKMLAGEVRVSLKVVDSSKVQLDAVVGDIAKAILTACEREAAGVDELLAKARRESELNTLRNIRLNIAGHLGTKREWSEYLDGMEKAVEAEIALREAAKGGKA